MIDLINMKKRGSKRKRVEYYQSNKDYWRWWYI
jgi:hypothetical protein